MSGCEVAYEEGIIKRKALRFRQDYFSGGSSYPREPEVCSWFVLGGLFALLEPEFKKSCLPFRL
jgi:hypothetical protein